MRKIFLFVLAALAAVACGPRYESVKERTILPTIPALPTTWST